jgi:hypothetical protein
MILARCAMRIAARGPPRSGNFPAEFAAVADLAVGSLLLYWSDLQRRP